MTKTLMAYPELRHPFEATPIQPEGGATVLYQGRTITLADSGEGSDLLINPEDLRRVNGFELKPEGACCEDLCIPLTADLLIHRNGRQWFNVSAFARLLGQPFVADQEARVWSFAEIPAKQQNMMVNAMAPDFEITDRKGQVIRLADFKGKKALIVTWSSW